MAKSIGSAADKPSRGAADAAAANPHAFRETVESIVIAVVLAFLFRTFIGEAFVIPTGSMAPTLQGNHKDVVCEKCGYAYQANASSENEEHWQPEPVVATTCPICRYSMLLDWKKNANHKSFTGDRILVSKFSYDLKDPRRWDVIVFKFPNNAKQNYIKRLIGLPGETLRIRHGDVYIRRSENEEFRIARKPPAKQIAMLQVVDDTRYLADDLVDASWPSRWQPWSPDEGRSGWRESGEDRQPIELGSSGGQRWLRYRHLVPEYVDWVDQERGNSIQLPSPGDDVGELITDFYAYNAFTLNRRVKDRGQPPDIGPDDKALGDHWVGDLALDADVEITTPTGTLLLDLVEGGTHYRCRIDVATGEATLAIEGATHSFLDENGQATASAPSGTTQIHGPGRHSVRFSNVDDELRLWVDERLVEFNSPTTFQAPKDQQPVWSESDPGDLAPVGIGADGTTLKLHRLRVLRDVYYIATNGTGFDNYNSDNEYPRNFDTKDIRAIMKSPRSWATHPLFQRRRSIDFTLDADQYFPMGDNSPQSKDGRLWGDPPYVDRQLLTGKAVLVYWPHSWNSPPFWPNFRRMRMIR